MLNSKQEDSSTGAFKYPVLEQQGLRGRQDDMLQIESLERTRTAEPQQLEVRGIEKKRQK